MNAPWIALEGPPTFPSGCACCLADSSEHLLVRSKFRAAESLLRPVDMAWRVPYCAACLEHVQEAWRRVGALKRRWMMLGVCLFLPGLLVHALLIAMIPVFLAGTGIVYSVARLRMKQVSVRPQCAVPTPAVLRRGPDRDRYSVRFLNPDYAARFSAGSYSHST